MHPADYDEFRKVLNELSNVLAPGKPLPDDVTVQRYAKALADQPLEVVKRMADRQVRYGKFFPKPFELRPKDAKPKPDEPEPQRSARQFAVSTNQRNWQALLKADSITARWKLLDAYVGRIDAQYARSDVAYEDKRAFALEVAGKLLLDSPADIFSSCWEAWHVAQEFWPQRAHEALPMRTGQLALEVAS